MTDTISKRKSIVTTCLKRQEDNLTHISRGHSPKWRKEQKDKIHFNRNEDDQKWLWPEHEDAKNENDRNEDDNEWKWQKNKMKMTKKIKWKWPKPKDDQKCKWQKMMTTIHENDKKKWRRKNMKNAKNENDQK